MTQALLSPIRDHQDPPGLAQASTGSCGAAGAALEPGRDRSTQTAAAGKDVQQVSGLWREVSAAGFVSQEPNLVPDPAPGPTAAPAGWRRRDKSSALQLSLRLHTALPVSPI